MEGLRPCCSEPKMPVQQFNSLSRQPEETGAAQQIATMQPNRVAQPQAVLPDGLGGRFNAIA